MTVLRRNALRRGKRQTASARAGVLQQAQAKATAMQASPRRTCGVQRASVHTTRSTRGVPHQRPAHRQTGCCPAGRRRRAGRRSVGRRPTRRASLWQAHARRAPGPDQNLVPAAMAAAPCLDRAVAAGVADKTWLAKERPAQRGGRRRVGPGRRRKPPGGGSL